MGGTELNIQCGKKAIVEEEQFVQSLFKSPDKLKKGSLTEIKVSSNGSNSNSLHNKRSFEEVHVETTDLLYRFERGLNEEGEWEYELEKKYNEEQIDSIISMLSFLENEHSGFSRFNDKSLHKEERKADVTGQLYQEACRGFKISKRNIDLQNEINHKKILFTLKEC
eukprot:CAMPEP_0185018736 /NCGR_PEP_ID=MMETSP1103-20130426/1411_1 /TAXON_ID=36769 /ORGANISM="Paraphysomonas bandaiensis, Strain Caron Lab Isolate" /LENGTH=166 /DNA_ID=CAMNT_0027548687 /DNA_START=76 /DNA_END=573 /DNA_ORIENTATION=-